MANSKYEYVKSFEVEDEIMLPNTIVVRVNGRNFCRFSDFHEFEKPNDMKALELMNECAKAVLEQFPDIIFSYGFSDEYSFIFKKATKFYQRRASKIHSLIVSFFTSIYITKWKVIFPQKDLRCAPSFRSQVISCASLEVLQAYLMWRQSECHLNNQHDTCLWHLIKSGKSEKEAKEMLKGSRKQDINELLYKCFYINYKKDIPKTFRQGTFAFKREVGATVEYTDDGGPVNKPRRKVIMAHSKNIASRMFWNDHSCLFEEFGRFSKDLNKTKSEHVKSFQYESRLMPSTWIVVQVDGCHFHSGIVSAVVSFFSSIYCMKWKEFFPHKEMKYPPYFDGRAVCYPSFEILRDYLAWRQVDCYINNQYNTCFWMLIKSGKSKRDAQNDLKGTQAQKKKELMYQLSGIDNYYDTLPPMFQRGSSVYWEKQEQVKMLNDKEDVAGGLHKRVVIKHCNIIEANFWEAHPEILTVQ